MTAPPAAPTELITTLRRQFFRDMSDRLRRCSCITSAPPSLRCPDSLIRCLPRPRAASPPFLSADWLRRALEAVLARRASSFSASIRSSSRRRSRTEIPLCLCFAALAGSRITSGMASCGAERTPVHSPRRSWTASRFLARGSAFAFSAPLQFRVSFCFFLRFILEAFGLVHGPRVQLVTHIEDRI